MRLLRAEFVCLFLTALAFLADGRGAQAYTTFDSVPLPRHGTELLIKTFPTLPAALDADEADDVRQSTEESGTLRQKLLAIAAKYGERSDIPYVWGGNAIGDPATCGACRTCIQGKRHLRVERRQKACQACRQCGVDCSHFVNRLYLEAGLKVPYLPTAKLKRLKPQRLRQLGLVDVGRDLSRARPGDLILTPHHVVMLLGMTGPTSGDFIHVSRSIKHGRVGGVEVVRGKDLLRYRGKLVRILRHTALDQEEDAPKRPLLDPRVKTPGQPLIVRLD